MLIACPECSGKLSSAAPTCPHCGFVQKPQAPAPAAPASIPAPPPLPPPPPPDLIPPSEDAVRGASRRTWTEWAHGGMWRLLIGAVILVLAVAVLVLVFLLANKMNNEPSAPQRIKTSARTELRESAWR